ncbi:MAG: class I SAM-dependent methyltransferase [Methanocorpusculum sp.]|uniref:HemK2/MTQ2 family protein methyltransferase n=1 Tax=Methanocorpusculum sp. TaxID=2058474 RepID=UPI002723FFB3|nr:HemK2/MTQ2 family protein methyltransferase [Methanocorpusculum sp.]MDO9522639.1 class I SAM-dependent methyltransferase [Methanocorpusculum sp.]
MDIDTTQIYFPSEDTYLLIKAALAEVKPNDRVLEIGTGSGAVAKSVTEITPQVLAVEINPHAAQYAHEVNGIEVIRGDLFKPVCGEFDLILFNAPYLPTTPEERGDDWLEYALDGGPSGREVVERFLHEAPPHLSTFGRILLLISSLTGIDEVLKLCHAEAFIALVVAEERQEDGEMLYVLRISRDLCSLCGT